MKLKHASMIFTILLMSAATGTCEDWGSLKGRIVFSGTAPAPEKLDVTRDEDVCGQHDLVDESLLVNPENGGLRNVVVWLASKGDIPVHPDLLTQPKPVKLDNVNCRFEPRIVCLRTGQTLQSTNSDPVAHNVAVYARRNSPFSIVIPEDRPLEKTFARPELLPIRVDCSIHAWMRAYLIITDHPYSAVTDADGKFEISHLPAGEWEFRFWHERPGYLKSITVNGDTRELKRGVYEVEITSADRDLGDLTVDGHDFAEEN